MDDNPAILEIVSELVSMAGYIPITASGGKECLERIASEKPDLVLLDINMPDMDGWTVLRKLKERGLTDDVKVMMLTATTEIGTDIFGLQDVVSGYIRKPFNNEELGARLREVLGDTVRPSESEVSQAGEGPQRPSLHACARRTSRTEWRRPRAAAKKYELRKASAIWSRRPNRRSPSRCSWTRSPTTSRGCASPGSIRPSSARSGGWRRPPSSGSATSWARSTSIRPTSASSATPSSDSWRSPGTAVVIIDGVEFLIVNNDFEKVLRMMHHIIEAVMEYKSPLIISVDPRTLSVREMALLERNMEIIETEEDHEIYR